jgi:hypothetical protein
MTFQQWLDNNFITLCELYRDFLDETGGLDPKPASPVAGLMTFAYGLYLETEHNQKKEV